MTFAEKSRINLKLLDPTVEDFDILLDDKDCVGISRSVISKFGLYLTEDEKYQCYCIGLFNALSGYNKSVKFLTHLYNHVKYSTLNYSNELKSKAIPRDDIEVIHTDSGQEFVDIQDLVEHLTEEESTIVHLYYYEKDSMRVAGKKLGYSRSSFNRRLTRIHQKLRFRGCIS